MLRSEFFECVSITSAIMAVIAIIIGAYEWGFIFFMSFVIFKTWTHQMVVAEQMHKIGKILEDYVQSKDTGD